MTGRKKVPDSKPKKKTATVKTTKKAIKAKPVKKAVDKTPRKTASSSKKKAVKPTATKSAVKSTTGSKAKTKSAAKATAAKKKSADGKEKAKRTEETMKILSRSKKHTPAVFKLPSKKQTPIVFSLKDVREVLKKTQEENNLEKKPVAAADEAPTKTKISSKPAKKKAVKPELKVEKHRVLGAASVADILGFNPKQKQSPLSTDEKSIPKKHLKYYRKLIDLREHVLSGLTLHSQQTLKRSSRDDSGDLSNYSQHMADAGTDNFERDFALNLLSSEQEALHEIEQAIRRINDGTYGICQFTGKAISKERLSAVPFTRYSLEGQAQKENQPGGMKVQRRGAFMNPGEAVAGLTTEDAED